MVSFSSGRNVPRGAIKYQKRYKQLIDYSGFQFGDKTPMDVDFYLDFRGKEIVLGEFKSTGKSLSYGQRRALTTLVMLLHQQGIEVLCFVARHDSKPDQLVDGANCLVTEILCPRARFGWHCPGHDRRVRELIDSWRIWHRTKR